MNNCNAEFQKENKMNSTHSVVEEFVFQPKNNLRDIIKRIICELSGKP